ncbi:MAG TPA: zinc ribbon domain-containing protein [Candidatus Binataceae bacterium]|nr:zinc ribbon domain-containing protein [Candidatus Binataceae bacterium]
MAESGGARPRYCSQCGAPVVVADASFCKDCGAPLAASGLLGELSFNPPALVATALSLMPGLGHFYAGRTWGALKWFFGVILAYAISPTLGLLIHIVCAVSAARAGMEDAARRGTARTAMGRTGSR